MPTHCSTHPLLSPSVTVAYGRVPKYRIPSPTRPQITHSSHGFSQYTVPLPERLPHTLMAASLSGDQACLPSGAPSPTFCLPEPLLQFCPSSSRDLALDSPLRKYHRVPILPFSGHRHRSALPSRGLATCLTQSRLSQGTSDAAPSLHPRLGHPVSGESSSD